jgi:hypothetical protein
MQDQLPQFDPFTLSVNRDPMLAAGVAHPLLRPGMPFGRAHAEPVQNRGDALIRQRARQFPDQFLGCRVGLPAMLAVRFFMTSTRV